MCVVGVMWRHVLVAPSTVAVGIGGQDFHFYAWSLDVVARGLFRWGPGFRTSVLYPVEGGVPLTADGTILGLALPLAPLTRLLGSTFTLNIVMLSAPPLNGAAAFWAYRKVLGSRCGGAVLGSLLFALSPYVMGHSLGHANLVHLWWLPLSMGLLFRSCCGEGADSTRRRQAVAGGAVLGFAMWIGSEPVAIAVVTIVPWALFLIVRYRRKVDVRLLLGAGAVAAVTAFPVVWGTVADTNHYQGAHQPPNVYVSDAVNAIVPTTYSLAGTVTNSASISSSWTGNDAENTGYLSVFGVGLVAWTLLSAGKGRRRAVAGLGAWALLLSHGPSLHIAGADTGILMAPGKLLSAAPLLKSILPARISFVMFFALGALVSLAAGERKAAIRAVPPRVRPLRLIHPDRGPRILAVATVLAVLPPLTMPSFDVTRSFGSEALSPIACGSKGGRSRAVALPRELSGYDALSWQRHGDFGVDLIRARFFIRTYPMQGRPLMLDGYATTAGGPVSDANVISQLQSLGTTCVVSRPDALSPRTISRLDSLLGPPRFLGGLNYWTVER